MTQNQLATPKRKNLICNFRAPNEALFLKWKSFVEWAKDNGYDVCYLTLNLVDAFLTGKTTEIKLPQQTIQINMANTFNYQVQKPRREPYSMTCVKREFQRTVSSILFESYVLEKARRLNTEFSYRDFLELKHDAFRRIIVRLKRKGKIVANPIKTKPQFYLLIEKLQRAKP